MKTLPLVTTAEAHSRFLAADTAARASQPINPLAAWETEGIPTGQVYRDGTPMRDWYLHLRYTDGSLRTIGPSRVHS